MSEYLIEIMEPLIDAMLLKCEKEIEQQGFQKGFQQAIRQSIYDIIGILHSLGHEDIEIKNAVKEEYGLSEDEIREYFE